MENLHLLRPYMLLLLIPALLAIVFLLHRKKSQNNWNKICDSHLLKHLSVDAGKTGARLSLGVLAIMWIVAVIAASGPAWRQAPQPAYRNQNATVVVLDLSYSMLAQDIKPSRIERAKYKVIDLLEKRKDGQLSLVVFAGDAHAVTPLTDDINTIKAQIEPLDPMIMPFPGSRPDQGVIKALELLKNGIAKNSEIILLTDGTEAYWQQLDDVAADVNAAGHTLAVIGVGTKDGAPIPAEGGGFIQDKRGAIVLPKLNDERLRRVALESGGKYIAMTADDRDINSISKFSLNKKQMDKEKKQQVSASWSDDGYWLVFLVLPIALYCFRKGVVFSFILALMILPSISHSAEPGLGSSQSFWERLWNNQRQLGVEQFNSGEYESAEQNLQGDTLWKGASQYRAGKFEDAIKTLEGDESSLADYNRGNALAHMERYEEAVAAYEQALEKDPENGDAKHNKELIEKHLQEQQSQEQQSQNQGGESQDGQNQEGQNQEGDNQQGESQQGESQQDQNQEGEQSQQQSGQQNDSEEQQDLIQPKQGANKQDQDGQQEQKEEQEKQAQKAKQKAEQQKEQQQDNKQQMLQENSEQPPAETKPLDQKTEQWLRQIPDNPGGLLKRKFYYESKKKYDKGTLPDTKNRW